jgi:hypothetical protein
MEPGTGSSALRTPGKAVGVVARELQQGVRHKDGKRSSQERLEFA